ncbi:MAG: hypothetical protein EXQ79_08555 [Acidimicrobiia bacterium]|nr:hypothetical protein [Acidimicrobiia bacterium]
MRRSLPLLTTLAVEVSAVVLLYRFIKEPGFAIPIALGCAAWMLSSTLLYLLARITRVPTAISAAGRVTLPSLRRRVDRALAASILTGAVLAGASPALAAAPLASDSVVEASAVASTAEPDSDTPSEPASDAATAPEPDPAPELPVRSGRIGDPEAIVEVSTTSDVPLQETPDTTNATTPTASESTPDSTSNATPKSMSDSASGSIARPERSAPPVTSAAPAASTKTPVVVPAAAATSYTVVAGDNFWEISARHLAAETGRERGALSTNDIVEYWVRVCNANRDRIRSGDVNLIDPGEVVELPAI